MSIENCLNKQHDLVEIGYVGEPCSVVRWCQECGAVVVDTDYDSRVSAGGVMEMRLPKTFQKVWKYRKENSM